MRGVSPGGAGEDDLMPRRTDWIDTRVDETSVSGSQSITSLLPGITPADARGMTLIRMIVKFGLYSNTTAGSWGVQRVDMGIGVASQEAFSASALPDPATASDKPARGWIYRTQQLVSQNGVNHNIFVDVAADIRSARKIENGELYLIWDNSPETGTTFTVNVHGLVRCLFKLA